MTSTFSKKKGVVFRDKPIILNIDELQANGNYDIDDKYDVETGQQGRFLDSRMSADSSGPRSILKKQGASLAKSLSTALHSQSQSLLQSLSTSTLLPTPEKQVPQKLSVPLQNQRSGGSRISAIANIKERIQKAVDDSKNGSQKIRSDVMKDLIQYDQLEKKELQQLNLQKYQIKENDEYDPQQIMMDGINGPSLSIKQPQKTRFQDSDLLKSPAVSDSQIKVSNKLQLPSLSQKQKVDSGNIELQQSRNQQNEDSAQKSIPKSYSEANLQIMKKQADKTEFSDDGLLKVNQQKQQKGTISPQSQALDERATSASSVMNKSDQSQKKQGKVTIQEKSPDPKQDPQKRQIIIQQKQEKVQNKSTSKPLVKFLSTSENSKPVNVQVVDADQLPEYLVDRDQELENLEKEIRESKRYGQRTQNVLDDQGFRKALSTKNSSYNFSEEQIFTAEALNSKKLLREKQKEFLNQLQQGAEKMTSFITMFTSEAQQQQKLEEHQREKLIKVVQDRPLFENPKESIKSFTDSISLQKSTLADVLKRRQAVQKTEQSAVSHPKLKNLAIMIQKKDFNKLDPLFNFQNRYSSNKTASEANLYGDPEELQKLKRKHQNMIKDEQTDEIKIILNEYLLLKYNFKHKWVQQLDISQFLFSKLPSICDLKNGQVCLTGGMSFENDLRYEDKAILLDT